MYRSRNPQFFILSCLVLLACLAAEAQAQFDPLDLRDLDGFLSASAVTGRPTLVAKPGALPGILAQLGAQPVNEFEYLAHLHGVPVRFDVLPTPNPPDLLPVCNDPDILTITYANRECYREKDESVVSCSLAMNCGPNKDQPCDYYTDMVDAPVDRCRLRGTSQCTEIRTIGWDIRYYYDAGCSLEIPGTREEVLALRCAL